MFVEANEPYPVSACHELLETFDTMHHSLLLLLDSLILHSLIVCTFLTTPYHSSLRGNPLLPAPPKVVPFWGPSQAGFSSHATLYAKGSLLLLCLQISADDFQIFVSSSYVSLEFPDKNSHVYWNPQQDKPQIPKFHYVLNKVHRLPHHLFLLLSLLSKGRALQQPSCSSRKPENCTSLSYSPK